MINKPELDIDQQWDILVAKIARQFGGKKPDMNAILFLIGVQELGTGPKYFSKEEKQDLMHIAICKVLSYSGYYVLNGKDAEGWPIWKPIQKLPYFDLLSQEKLLQMHILEYFDKEVRL